MGIWNWLFGKGKRATKNTPPRDESPPPMRDHNQRADASLGAAKLVELCSRNDLFESSKEEMRQEAAALFKQEGAAGIRSLVGLIRELLACRSKEIFEALDVAQRMEPTATLVEAAREVCSSPALAPRPASCRFTPDIVGGGRVGWNDGTRANVVSYAQKVVDTLTKTS